MLPVEEKQSEVSMLVAKQQLKETFKLTPRRSHRRARTIARVCEESIIAFTLRL